MATVLAEEAQAKAEDAVKAKQQFLSNMSHEIRTPMNAIIGFTKVVLKTELTDKQKEYLTAIKLSGDTLIVLINDILDLAKVDAGKMTFEQIPFKLSASVTAMVHLFETKIQEKNLALVMDYDTRIPEVLMGDPVRLHQIILNLVSNAVKFTSEGKITVGVRLLVQDKEKVILEFAVTDTGIGIEEAKLDTVFDNFQQATSGTSRLYGGTGLGLAIVKNLVEPQGGTVNVRSRVGEGSTFSFILSFPKTSEKAAADLGLHIDLEAGFKNVKVLVVEDIALNQLLMKTLLEDFGFDMEVAGNGQIALEKLRTTAYDIVLMDLQMPVMNGFEATEYIRKELKLKVPIIALTADVTTVDVDKCKAVGMNDYISKPIDDKLLYSKIIKYVKLAGSDSLPSDGPEDSPQPPAFTCVNFDYLKRITKSEARMAEMIRLYLQEIPQAGADHEKEHRRAQLGGAENGDPFHHPHLCHHGHRPAVRGHRQSHPGPGRDAHPEGHRRLGQRRKHGPHPHAVCKNRNRVCPGRPRAGGEAGAPHANLTGSALARLAQGRLFVPPGSFRVRV
ncbi:ATP-binding protein [Hymenobacter humi]|uniref:histidine kinase n=1 Tax=Hymenobacter humi TaxID=1411620 RepID=A0ABW2UFF8_9BACT